MSNSNSGQKVTWAIVAALSALFVWAATQLYLNMRGVDEYQTNRIDHLEERISEIYARQTLVLYRLGNAEEYLEELERRKNDKR